ncbi:MAG: type IV secretion system DNA-binding domain-containing protein [Candidatus Thiodiazotropha sp.]|nr:type IV secretion system DNA-binding domain-containing protein [Candidatus Thiodiazotropha sp.]
MSTQQRDIHIHPRIPLSKSREQGNFCILGTTGAGKSTVIKPLVNQVIQRKSRIFIFDEKKEYTAQFFDPDTTTLIAAWDKRGTPWNIYQDANDRQAITLIAECLLKVAEGKDEIWIKGARLLLRGMMMWLLHREKPWGWSELAKLLTLEQSKMQKILYRCFPLAAQFIQEESKTTQGFYVQLISELDWIEELAEAWPNSYEAGFSIREWATKSTSKNVLLIQSDSRFSHIGSPLCSALISLLTRFYLAQPENSASETWLFIDEAASLPPTPALMKWLELARARGGRAVIGTQSLSQLRSLYGAEPANTLLNLTTNVIAMRMGAAGQEAEFTAGIFQKRIVERPNQRNENASWSQSEEWVVSPSDLVQIPPPDAKGLWGYLMIPGWGAVYKLQWPLFRQSPITDESIPATWTRKSKTNNVADINNRLK